MNYPRSLAYGMKVYETPSVLPVSLPTIKNAGFVVGRDANSPKVPPGLTVSGNANNR